MSEFERKVLAWTIIFLISSSILGYLLWAAPAFCLVIIVVAIIGWALIWALDQLL